MYYAYNLSGSDFPAIMNLDIASTQAITAGQVVKLDATSGATRGSVIPAVVAETGAILGVAAETHSGSADSVNPRANGTKIRVYTGTQAVYGCTAFRFTATGGSTTTVVYSGLATFADDDFNGGYVKLVAKGASSVLTDPVGTTYKVSDFVASTKTFTIPTAPGGVTAGDIFMIFPPVGFAKGNFTTNLQQMDYTVATGTVAKVVDMDLNKNVIYWTPQLQVLGNKAV